MEFKIVKVMRDSYELRNDSGEVLIRLNFKTLFGLSEAVSQGIAQEVRHLLGDDDLPFKNARANWKTVKDV